MRDGKWIAGLTADTLVPEAAKRVLVERLGVVVRLLPLAAQKPEKDVEYVHQLRVGTRRAGAAVRIFQKWAPQAVRRTKSRLRRVRRAAGDARDWDVLRLQLADWSDGRADQEQPGVDFLRGWCHAQRVAAQHGLRDALDTEFPHLEAALTELGEWSPGKAKHSLAELGADHLADLANSVDGALAEAQGSYEHLHQARIQGKKLRYAMEIFAPCLGADFRTETYPLVEEMQKILGHMNDSHGAVTRLGQLRTELRAGYWLDWQRVGPGIDSLLSHHKRQMGLLRRQFTTWKRRWPEVSASLLQCLEASAG